MIYAFGDCELDTERFEVRRGGERRPVEPQVLDVLVHLVRNRDRLVTREELLARVWGHSHVSDATVSSRLMAARRAIGDDGREQSLIRTVRGRGYRFVGEVAEAPEAPVEAPAAGPPVPDAEGPIGRESERAELHRLLDLALAGERRLVVVTGEAGAGKTTLVEGFAAEASRGTPSLLEAGGRCVEPHGPREPYMPLLECLGGLARGGAGEQVLQTLSARGPTWLLQMPWLASADALEEARLRSVGAAPERMLREMVETLEALSARAPLVLVLDDLHWADDATLSLLAHLARRREPARLMVLATARPAPGQRSEGLLRELVPRGHCTEIALPMLSRGAVEEYLRHRHPGLAGSEAVAELVHRRTSGNPLFIDCLLRSWTERGAMVDDDGRWRLRAEPQELVGQVPDTLRELIEQDIGGLGPDEQRILETAAVVGTEFSAAAVASGAGLETEDVEARCADLARHRLLRERPPAEWLDGTVAAAFAFTHDLHRQVLYERLPASRRARLHGEVAARLESAHAAAPAERAAELAGHLIRSRRPAGAVRYLRLSAQQAIARGAPAEAVRDVRTALELMERTRDVPQEDGTELWLHAALAGALVSVSGFAPADADRAIRRALEIARARDDSPSAARLLNGLGGMHEYRGEHRVTEALAGEALRVGGETPEIAVEAHDLMACSLFHQGRFSAALEQAEQALSLHRPQHDYAALAPHGEHPLVSSHEWAGLALWCMGQPEQALGRIHAAVGIAADPGRRHSLAQARVQAARLHQMRGEPSEAEEQAQVGLTLAQEYGFGFHAAAAQVLVGWAQAVRGQEGGVDLLRAGLEAHRAMGAQLDRPYFLALLAEALWASGRPEQGLETITEAARDLGGAHTFFWESELHRLRGALTLELNGSDGAGDAEASFRQALEAARRQGAGALELRAATSLARVLRDRGEEREAGMVLEVACAPFGAGPEMPDLHEARTLLSRLRASSL